MKKRKFTKAKVSFIALFLILTVGTSILMTACQPSITPTSSGVATITKTPIPLTNTPAPTNTPSNVAISQGDIAFIGIVTSSANQFAFVTLNTIPANAQINFTNWPYDSTVPGFNTSITAVPGAARGVITWAPTSSVAPYTEIYITGGATATGSVVGGSALTTLTGGFSLNSGEDQVYCYQGTLASPTLFVGAIGIYTSNANVEPYFWNTGTIVTVAPTPGVAAAATPWAGLPASLAGGQGTTMVYNGFNNLFATKSYRDWVYQCKDGTGSDTKANLLASINNVGTNTGSGGSAVTVYFPAGTVNNETAVAYSSFGSNGLSIISGNSMGTSFASTNAAFPNASAVSFGICNQNNSDTPTGYTW